MQIDGVSYDVWISIHALLAESDCFFCVKLLLQLIFLSTLSLRRATEDANDSSNANLHFYPRSPCGERLVHALKLADLVLFLSTLSLRRATTFDKYKKSKMEFLSTLSLRRATL